LGKALVVEGGLELGLRGCLWVVLLVVTTIGARDSQEEQDPEEEEWIEGCMILWRMGTMGVGLGGLGRECSVCFCVVLLEWLSY
jgi:hypothetical protein